MRTTSKTTRTASMLTGALLLVLAAVAADSPPAGFWAPEGFVAQADTLIRRGRLELRCGQQDSIVAAFPAGGPEEAFFDASYLRADVRTFNSSPDATRSPFLVEGCRLVGVDPFYHRIDLPYNRLPRWRGDVRFTFRRRTATLEGGADQELEIRHPLDRADAARSSERVAPDEVGARTYTSLLHVTEPGTPEVLADAFFVGASPVLADRRDVGTGEILRVNGFRAPPGRVVRLESGDWIQLVGEGRGGERRARAWTYLAQSGDRAGTASFVRVRNDQVDRLFPARRLRPLLEPFSQAMDLALQSVPGAGEGGVAEADVRLTVDRELDEALGAEVTTWCEERAHPDRPRGVSLLVMDAFTGAVRALPSCPGRENLAPFEPLSTRTRQRFLRNQNLVPHPLGSAAKPFWTAAVASTYPNFLDMEIPAHAPGPAGTVLGCPLAAPYGDTHGGAGWTGLEEFLRRSCNRYVVELASAALAVSSERPGASCREAHSVAEFARCLPAGPGGEEVEADAVGRLRFCDRVVSTVLAPGMRVVGGTCDDLQLVDATFTPGPLLGELTNVSVYREPSPGLDATGSVPELGDQYRLGRYRTDAWRAVLFELDVAGDTAHAVNTALRFAGVSPQAGNLALNTVEELRTDWVNLVLGGENGRWSNFEVAEATARLMTGRRVRGILADSVGVPGGGGSADEDGAPERYDPLPDDVLHPGVRRRVLHAMELAARPGGTAGRLGPGLDRIRERLRTVDPRTPWDLYAFAKTGTPSVEKYVAGGERVERQGGLLILGLLAVPADRGRERAAAVEAWISACRLSPGLRRGILEVPPVELLDDERAVALSVAVYLDDLDREEGSGAAVTLTGRVLDELSDYMEREVRRKLEAIR